jgi:hypothetical protein
MEKKKLKLEILDSDGSVKVTHHFFYNVNDDNTLRLTMSDGIYDMDKNGKII